MFGLISIRSTPLTSAERATFESNAESKFGPPPTEITQILWDDMHGDHEAYPHGVPHDYDWYNGSILKDASVIGTFEAFNITGMVYEEEGGNPSQNARVAIRNFKGYYLSIADGQWHELQSVLTLDSTMGGGYYESFNPDDQGGQPRNHWVQDVDGQDLMTCWAGDGWNYHFYPPRAPWDYSDIAQVAVSCEGKLTLADPLFDAGEGDDISEAKFIMAISCDRWINMTAGWEPDFSNNDDIGIGRFKKVTEDWRIYTMITDMAYDDLVANPPPLALQ